MVKLNAGKQGFFDKIVSKLEESKAKVSAELERVKDEIKLIMFLQDTMVSLMGYYEIPRFRNDKL